MSLITADVELALQDAFTVAGQKFIWKGTPYDCVVNAEQNVLVTSKSLFGANGYPQPGDTINMPATGRRCQITTIGNSTDMFVAGGINNDQVFVDDPSNPALAIGFNSFIGR